MSECAEIIVGIYGQPPERMDERVRVLAIAVEDVFRASMMAASGNLDVLKLPVLKGIPADAEVAAVYYSFERRSFMFGLRHPSFEPVARGAEVPVTVVEMGQAFEMAKFRRVPTAVCCSDEGDCLAQDEDEPTAQCCACDTEPLGFTYSIANLEGGQPLEPATLCKAPESTMAIPASSEPAPRKRGNQWEFLGDPRAAT